MGVSTGKSFHARHSDGPDRRDDPRKAAAHRTGGGRWLRAGLTALLFLSGPASADTAPLRIATFGTDLSRQGPGLLLRDILSEQDEQVEAVLAVLTAARADVILLTGIDYDMGLAALGALADRLAAAGASYPYRFALRPNRGMHTGLDMDGDGRRGSADDAQGFGRFAGAGGMAVLSRLPVLAEEARDFSGFLWRDLPGARLPEAAPEVLAIQRLSTTGHWEVPVRLPGGGSLRLLAWHASPPVFGHGDRNARRNHDETAFWLRLLAGELPVPPPEAPFVILGNANLDPEDGDGRNEAIRALLAHPMVQDPAPRGAGGAAAPDPAHGGDPALDTAAHRAGNLRVTYVLPSAEMEVAAAGILWPAPGEALAETAAAASRHRLVWVDLAPP